MMARRMTPRKAARMTRIRLLFDVSLLSVEVIVVLISSVTFSAAVVGTGPSTLTTGSKLR